MRQPTALVACEFSGRVRDALTAAGFYAVSCDLLPSETEGEHIQGDVLDVLDWGWDLLIAHPPCTDLATSGARWFPEKIADGRQARAPGVRAQTAGRSDPVQGVGKPEVRYLQPDPQA